MYNQSSLSAEVVNNYFLKLNPIAEKIAQDIDEVKLSYGHLWCTFNLDEQNDIINEHLIKPEITLKYSETLHLIATSPSLNIEHILNNAPNGVSKNTSKVISKKPNDFQNCKTKEKCGDGKRVCQKRFSETKQNNRTDVCDDEHSIPFSYRTKSQINLHTCLLGSVENISHSNLNTQQGVIIKTKRSDNPVSLYKKLKNEIKSSLGQQTISLEYRKNVVQYDDEIRQDQSLIKKNEMDALLQDFATCKPTHIYMDLPSENDECLSLVQACESNNNLCFPCEEVASESYGKASCEELQLLDNDVNLRKGFEFLNNW